MIGLIAQMLGRGASRSSPSARVAALVWHHRVAGEVPIALPLSRRVEADDREIAVDGCSVRFVGARLAYSQRWTGAADLDNVRVMVTTDGPSRLSAIVTSRYLELPGGGPYGE